MGARGLNFAPFDSLAAIRDMALVASEGDVSGRSLRSTGGELELTSSPDVRERYEVAGG